MSQIYRRPKAPNGRRSPLSVYGRIKLMRCWAQVREMLVAGHPVPRVVEYIQTSALELTDVARPTLITILTEIRRKEIPVVEKLAVQDPKALDEAKKEFHDKYANLRGIQGLLNMQLERIQMGREMEKKIKVINTRLASEVSLAHSFYESMQRIQMEMGFFGEKKLGTITVMPQDVDAARRKYGEQVATAMMSPESRGRVLSILSQVRALPAHVDAAAAIKFDSGS
jgi:hypothetical protein